MLHRLEIYQTGEWHIVGEWDPYPLPKPPGIFQNFRSTIYELQADCALVDPDGRAILAYRGRQFNGMSVPRPFRIFLDPMGQGGRASTFHDIGYEDGFISVYDSRGLCVQADKPMPKAYFDRAFRAAMALAPYTVTPWLRRVIYGAVVVGGWPAWLKHRRKDNKTI